MFFRLFIKLNIRNMLKNYYELIIYHKFKSKFCIPWKIHLKINMRLFIFALIIKKELIDE